MSHLSNNMLMFYIFWFILSWTTENCHMCCSFLFTTFIANIIGHLNATNIWYCMKLHFTFIVIFQLTPFFSGGTWSFLLGVKGKLEYIRFILHTVFLVINWPAFVLLLFFSCNITRILKQYISKWSYICI